jgi:hypothetical protein
MRLDDARLCLDCEEIHEEQECPSCGSEAFGFLTRWIKSTRDTTSAKPVPPKARPPEVRPTVPTGDQLDAWRQIVEGKKVDGRGKKLMTGGLVGLVAMGLAGWVWSRPETPADKRDD